MEPIVRTIHLVEIAPCVSWREPGEQKIRVIQCETVEGALEIEKALDNSAPQITATAHTRAVVDLGRVIETYVERRSNELATPTEIRQEISAMLAFALSRHGGSSA